jgi:hypothetical protein
MPALPAMPAPDGANLLSLVLANDRPAIVLLLVGVNDVAESGPGRPPVDPAAIAERIARLAAQARAAGAQVIVSTLLPNRRDPAPTIAEVNRRICAAERDCLRLDRAWESAGGDDLLGDEIHPSERGHAVIAAAFLDALRTRGLVPAAAAPARVPAPAPSAAHAAGGSASPDAGVAPDCRRAPTAPRSPPRRASGRAGSPRPRTGFRPIA